MKKKISVLLSLIILSAGTIFFPGCSNDSREEKPMLHLYTFGEEQADVASVTDEFNKRYSDTLGANLKLHIIGRNSYTERIKNIIENEECDVFFVGFNNQYYEQIENGYLFPLKQLIEEKAPKLKENMPEYLYESAFYDGEIYAVPNEQINVEIYSVYVKKDIAEEYDFNKNKIESVKDLEEFYDWVLVNHPELFPVNSFRMELLDGLTESESCGYFCDCLVATELKDGTVEILHVAETEAYKELAKLSEKWHEKGYLRKDMASISNDNYGINEGLYASVITQGKPGGEGEFKAKYGYDVVSVCERMGPYMKNHALQSTMLGVSSKSKHPEEAIRLIEMLNTDKEAYNLICFGIEGKHYTVNEKGKAVIDADAGYNISQAWAFGNQFNAIILEGQDESVWEETRKLNAMTKKSPFIGFDFANFTNKYQDKLVQIESVSKRWYSNAYNGSVPFEEWYPTYMEELRIAGVEEVKEALQKLVDEYLENKKG